MNTQWVAVVWYENTDGKEGLSMSPFTASSEAEAIGLCFKRAVGELGAKRIICISAFDTKIPLMRLPGTEKFTPEQILEIWAAGVKQWEEKESPKT